MDRDPALDVTLSNGRRVATFRVAALDGDLGVWSVVDPSGPCRVILGEAEALATRRQLDARIAARLAVGWVPVEASAADASAVPLPRDLALQLGSLLAAITRERVALRAADPSGQLWAASLTFVQQAQRFGVALPPTRLARAQRERHLGALAERAGDIAAAIRHYRAALAAHPRVGVRRRLAQLEGAPPTVPRPVSRPDHAACRSPRRPARGASSTLIGSVQLACRIDAALHTTVRAQAARAGQTLRTFVVQLLEQAIQRPPRRA